MPSPLPTIRDAQLKAIGRAQRKPYEVEVRGHLVAHFAAECDKLGREGLIEYVSYIFDRAETHGYLTLKAICRYADLSMALGRDFDQDPKLGWVQAILKSKALTDADVRLDFLCREAVRRLEEGD